MTNPPNLQLTLDAPDGCYQPGEELTARFQIEAHPPVDVRSAELSVLWYTAGKGDEDMAVHHFERLVDEPPAKPLDLRLPRSIVTRLPLSPLSYDGEIVKVCWCVRLRLFMAHGQTAVAEAGFRLGDLPAARQSATADTADETGASR